MSPAPRSRAKPAATSLALGERPGLTGRSIQLKVAEVDHRSASVHAFVDESRRGDTYLVVAALIDPRDLKRLRKVLSGLLFAGQRELHFKKETPQRRRLIISALVEARVLTHVYLSPCGRVDEDARQTCLSRLADDLLDLRAGRLVLDSRADRDIHDVRTIRDTLGKRPSESNLTYEHLNGGREQLLWVADAVAWCFGAGGDWRRRAAPLIGRTVEVAGPR